MLQGTSFLLHQIRELQNGFPEAKPLVFTFFPTLLEILTLRKVFSKKGLWRCIPFPQLFLAPCSAGCRQKQTGDSVKILPLCTLLPAVLFLVEVLGGPTPCPSGMPVWGGLWWLLASPRGHCQTEI